MAKGRRTTDGGDGRGRPVVRDFRKEYEKFGVFQEDSQLKWTGTCVRID